MSPRLLPMVGSILLPIFITNMKKRLIFALVLVLVLIIAVPVQLFLIGEPVDGSTVNCDVRESENQVDLYVTTPESAVGFTDFRLRQEGTTLYIDFRKVLTSPLYDGEKSIYIEKCDLTEIVLGGVTVWTA